MQAKRRKMGKPTRRTVLQAGLGWVAAPSIAGAMRVADARPCSRRTLVLLHLSGGNDGLNTVIPYRDPMYYELRPRLSCVARDAVAISDTAALHPALSALVPLFDRGVLAIVEGVGLPDPDYSHIGSCRIWGAETAKLTRGYAVDERVYASWPSTSPVAYRCGQIGRTLAEVARQVTSSHPPEVIVATAGGFDTHVDQLPMHEQALRELGDGLAAFLRKLEMQGDAGNVVLAAWSEFGRRPAENATGGTDHGSAGPIFLLGRGVRGGIYGRPPSLTHTDFGNLIPSIGLRDVCTTLADRWLGNVAGTSTCRTSSLRFL